MVEVFSVLRALHILSAIAWAGGAVYSSAVVMAAVRAGGAGAKLEAAFFATGRHGPYMGASSLATVLFGGAVISMGDYSSEALGAGAMVMGLSMTLALAAFGVGIFGHLPTEKRLKPLAARFLEGGLDGPAASEYEALRGRNHRFARASMALIGFAMLGMLTFRMFL